MALLLYPESAHSDFGLRRSGRGSNGILLALSRCPCPHRTGVIASIKLFLLLALRWRCCRVALQGPAGAAQAFASIALAFCLHPAGVIASIMLLSMSPALCQHHCHVAGRFCSCCAGIFVPIAFALYQHCNLASAQSQNSRDTCLRHCQHRAIVVAGNCRHCCPRHTGIFALVVLVLPTSAYLRCASITNWHLPSHDAVATCAGEASLLRSSLPVTLLLYPAFGPQQLGCRRSGQGSNGVVAWPLAASLTEDIFSWGCDMLAGGALLPWRSGTDSGAWG